MEFEFKLKKKKQNNSEVVLIINNWFKMSK